MSDLRPDSPAGKAAAKADLRAHEDQYLADFFAFAQPSPEPEEVEVHVVRKATARTPARDFRFKIRPLDDSEYVSARRDATPIERNKNTGQRQELPTNIARYRSGLIYAATIPAHRPMWENRKLWDEYNVINAVDFIDKILHAGEKAKVVEQIDLLSGFENDIEDLAKN